MHGGRIGETHNLGGGQTITVNKALATIAERSASFLKSSTGRPDPVISATCKPTGQRQRQNSATSRRSARAMASAHKACTHVRPPRAQRPDAPAMSPSNPHRS